MNYENDEKLFVQALVNGCPEAWRQFQIRYSRVIQRAISSVTSQFSAVVGADDIKEIYAWVCFRLLDHDKRKLKRFDAARGHSFRGWLGMVAVQSTYDYMRRRRRQLGRELDAGREIMASASAADPYEECWAGQRSRIAAALLEQVGTRDREFLCLFLQGRLPGEIAEAMGITLSTVYSKKHKISAQLTRLAEQHDLAA
jgi:RNA polymerase sigma-70 factor (ECF subfamily)